MDIFFFRDVQSHDVRRIVQITQVSRGRTISVESGSVELLDKGTDGANGTEGTHDAGLFDRFDHRDRFGAGTQGGREERLIGSAVGRSDGEKNARAEAQGRGSGDGNGRPVTVNVNVLNNSGGGETRNAERGTRNSGDGDTRAEAQRRKEHGKALAAIRKHTDLLPGILDKVEATPLRTAALLSGSGRRKLGTFGTVIEEDFTASAHFTNLTWGGKRYVVRQTVAVIIETLYIAQKSFDLPGLRQDEIFAQVYGANKKKWPSGEIRIQNFFRTGDAKRLWDDGFIGHDGKGNFHLNVKIHTHTQ